MSKKKKTASKQNKPDLQKNTGKPAKDAAQGKKTQPEAAKKEADSAAKKPAMVESPAQAEVSKPQDKNRKEKSQEAAVVEKKSEATGSKAPKIEQPKSEPPKAKAEKPQEKPASQPESKSSKSGELKPVKEQSKAAKSKKKEKAPRQAGKESVSSQTSAKAEPAAESDTAQPETNAETIESEAGAAKEEVSSKGAQDSGEESNSALPVVADEVAGKAQPVASELPKKVAKTLIDEEVQLKSKAEPPSAVPAEPRKIAKTMLEVDIGSLKESAAKATGTGAKIEAPSADRKVPKTLMEVDTEGLRNAVEASSKAIEDEIAAAIKDAEAGVPGRDDLETSAKAIEEEIAAAIKEAEVADGSEKNKETAPASPKTADRPIARTMLDVRTDELFELANFEFETSETSPAPAEDEPRKVAKTMLEINAPDLAVIAEASKSMHEVASEAAHAKLEDSNQMRAETQEAKSSSAEQSGSEEEVSLADLNEFAQALKDDKPMQSTTRAERLRKTLLGIRRRGLASRASLPDVQYNLPVASSSDEHSAQPVHVSRSLHPLDNFSFDDISTDDESSSQAADHSMQDAMGFSGTETPHDDANANQEQSFAPDDDLGSSDGHPVASKRTGTVQMDVDPHGSAPDSGSSDTGFKGVTTVWPNDQQPEAEAPKTGSVKPERFVARTMLDMDFLKESLSSSIVRAEEKIAEEIAQKAALPPKQTLTQDDYKLATPGCPFTWSASEMTKDKVRYCTQCNAQVYNFAGFDMQESQAMIFARENREKAQLYKREDGKFMTQDCPIAVKKAKDKTMLIGGAVVVVVLLVLMVAMSFLNPPPPQTTTTEAPSSTKPTDGETSSTTTEQGSITKTGSNSTGTASSTSTTKLDANAYGKTGGRYVRGQGVIRPPVQVQTQPTTDPVVVPGTTSGYDEGGQFWQKPEQGNN